MGCVQHFAQVPEWALIDETIGVGDIQKARLPCEARNVYHVFIKDCGFNVGVGNRVGPHLLGLLHHGFWWNLVAVYVLRGGLGDFPILAELTLKIASRRCNR